MIRGGLFALICDVDWGWSLLAYLEGGRDASWTEDHFQFLFRFYFSAMLEELNKKFNLLSDDELRFYLELF